MDDIFGIKNILGRLLNIPDGLNYLSVLNLCDLLDHVIDKESLTDPQVCSSIQYTIDPIINFLISFHKLKPAYQRK